LQVIAPGAFGGLERVVTQLGTGLSQGGTAVGVVAILDQDVAEPGCLQTMRSAGVEVFPVSVPARAYRRERAALRDILSTWRADVVHTHGYRADVLMRGVIQRAGRPAVATAHGFTGGGPKNRFFEWLDRRALRRFDAVIAVSRGLGDRLKASGVPAARLHVIPNAWAPGEPSLSRAEARAVLGLREDLTVVGWVGRLGREKGCDIALAGLAALGDPSVHLSVIGEGRELPVLRDLAKQLGIASQVHWHGAVASADRLFAAFDLFCLSSRTEGTPMVLFEAMAVGVPIVATRVGGVSDMLATSEAILVPSESPPALAEGLRAVLNDPVAGHNQSAAARERLDHSFALGPWLERHRALYSLLLERT
jgi:glycosyltransferase involved in cell wall biosynthesis